jgi:multiple sugar transport system permease protein
MTAVFLAPFLIGFLLFTSGPVAAAVALSFFKYSGLEQPEFIGFDNFAILAATDQYWKSWAVTIVYGAGSAVLTLVLSLVIALLIFRTGRLRIAWTAIVFVPTLLAGTGESLVQVGVWNQQGLANALLRLVGITGPSWMNDPQWVIPGLVAARYWTIGALVLILLAARDRVPTEMLDAARIDGASPWQSFRSVTFPFMSPVILYAVILSVISGIQSFAQVWIMSRGGPGDASTVIGLYVYREAFANLRVGYASAASWIVFVVTVGLSAALIWSARYWVYYEHTGSERST